jgi:hypothetical protein
LALFSNTTGQYNTATGRNALYSNNGNNNTAIGLNALTSVTTGNYNIGLGRDAGANLTTGDSNIDIGNAGVAGDAGAIRIGDQATQTATFIAGIYGETTGDVASTTAVVIDTNGNLGTTASSERFKKDIGPMDNASDAILALRPVTFHYKNDSKGIPQFGLVAEDVAKVNPDLVVRDKNGAIYTVRYDAVNAMLLNEFLKEHRAFLKEQRKVEAQEATITQLKQDFQFKLAKQQKQIEALTTGLQKVNDKLEISKSAPQMVGNSQ